MERVRFQTVGFIKGHLWLRVDCLVNGKSKVSNSGLDKGASLVRDWLTW